MHKAASKRLMQRLTGKEIFAAIMQSYADMLQHKPATFSDDAIDAAKLSAFSKPHEEREFYRWCDSKQVIDYLVTEIRVDAMQANWQLSYLLIYCLDAMKGDDSPHKTPEKLKQKAHNLQRSFHKISLYIAALDGFSDALHVNLTPLLHGGVETLAEQLAHYDTIRALFDEYLMLESDMTQLVTDHLPPLSFTPTDEILALQAELTATLRTYRGNDFTTPLKPLIEAMEVVAEPA